MTRKAHPGSCVHKLEDAIIDNRCAYVKPMVRTETGAVILAKECRALDARDAIKNGYRASDSEH